MADKATPDILIPHLFFDDQATVYAVLDGASIPGLLPAFEHFAPEAICLYRGELDPELAQTAPYLAVLERDGDFTRWVLQEGWGRHWGIFASARADLKAARKHFRTFLMVYSPDNRPLYFRYYDPRVLRVYLPTCDAQQTRVMFGPVSRYFAEGEDPRQLHVFAPGAEHPESRVVKLDLPAPASQTG